MHIYKNVYGFQITYDDSQKVWADRLSATIVIVSVMDCTTLKKREYTINPIDYGVIAYQVVSRFNSEVGYGNA